MEVHDELLDFELFDGQLEDKLQEYVLEEVHWLLQLVDTQLSLELFWLLEQQLTLFDDDGQLHEELIHEELCERQLDESLLQVIIDEQLQLLLLLEKLLKHELSLLLEQHEYAWDDEGQLSEELQDKELLEELIEEKLQENMLEEQLKLLLLIELELKQDIRELLELHDTIFDDCEQLEDSLQDGELFESDIDEELHECMLDELHLLLKLVEIQLKLEDTLLLEQQGVWFEDDNEVLEELDENELKDRQHEE